MAGRDDQGARRRARKAAKRRERKERKATGEGSSGRDGAGQDAGQDPKAVPAKAEGVKPVDIKRHDGKPRHVLGGKGARHERKPMDPARKRHAAVAAACAGCLVVGALLGYVNAPDVRVTGLGTTSIAETDTSHVLATWTEGPTSHDVTMGDYAKWASLTASNGSYDVPGASDVVNYIQWQVELEAADREDIQVTDDDIDAYAKDQLGADSIDSLASSAGMSADDVRDVVRDNVRVSKLRDKVAGTIDVESPSAPDKPEDGHDDDATADYAGYITNLAGDEWDSSANDGNGGWKDASSPLAQALADYDVTNDSATYKAAQAAYQERSSEYSDASQKVSKAWSGYLDNILKDVTIDLRDAMVGSN